MKQRIIISAIALIMLTVTLPIAVLANDEADMQTMRGIILEVVEVDDNPLGVGATDSKGYMVEVRLTSGPESGRTMSIYHITSGNPAYDVHVQPGDKVLLEAVMNGTEVTELYIADHVRDRYVFIMAGVFIALVLLLGGKAGAKSLISLVVTIFLVLKVLLPQLLAGRSPMLLAVIVSALAIMITMFVVGGINKKSIAAIIGTVGGVIVAGLLAFGVGTLTRLTGLSHEETQMLLYIPQGIDFDYRGLLFAGMVIGALGAVMDVGMSIASSMFEMKRVSPNIGAFQLFRSGMNVGRDIMGTMTNTLILAYTGGSTSMLLLFQAYNVPLDRILNLDKIVTELVRALSGSIGLVAAIPLTAAAAAWLVGKSAAVTTSEGMDM